MWLTGAVYEGHVKGLRGPQHGFGEWTNDNKDTVKKGWFKYEGNDKSTFEDGKQY